MDGGNKDECHVYLDYNATTPLEPSVVDIIHDTLCNAWKNPSSSYKEGCIAKQRIEMARQHIAEMVNGQANEIILLSGGTEANALVFHSLTEDAAATWNCVDEQKRLLPHVITSNIEHDSIAGPIKHLCRKNAISCTFVPVSASSGTVEVDQVLGSIKPNTRLISIMLANNETGVIQPIQAISKQIQKLNNERRQAGYPVILFHTDAAQGIGKIPVDVDDLKVDYLTIVGHKFYAPRVGALWIHGLGTPKSAPFYPMFFGGGQERGYRPGTESTAMISGLGEAARLVTKNIDKYHTHMKKIRDYLENSLEKAFPGMIHFNSRYQGSSRLPNTCNFSLLGENLEGYKILRTTKVLQASVGAACHSDKETRPSHILLACGISNDVAKNALRLSVGRATTMQDIDAVVDDLKQAVEFLSKSQSNGK